MHNHAQSTLPTLAYNYAVSTQGLFYIKVLKSSGNLLNTVSEAKNRMTVMGLLLDHLERLKKNKQKKEFKGFALTLPFCHCLSNK